MSSAQDIFQNRGRKVDEDRIRAEKDDEIARLKATIAEAVQENLEIKKKIGERLQRRETPHDIHNRPGKARKVKEIRLPGR